MDEREFSLRADAMLARIEVLLEDCTVDFDYEMQPGGVIELEFEHASGSKIVINRHVVAREIWVAAKSGGFHFRFDEAAGGRWLGTRDGVELLTRLSQCMSEQAGVRVELPLV